jgi:hypothetical protein
VKYRVAELNPDDKKELDGLALVLFAILNFGGGGVVFDRKVKKIIRLTLTKS